MTASEQFAFEEIYRIALKGDGGRERKIRHICEAMLGTRAAVVKADFKASKPMKENNEYKRVR